MLIVYFNYSGLYKWRLIEFQLIFFYFSHVPQFCDAICSMSFESLGLEQPSDVPMVS
jgi:hypothetical protein